MRCYLAAVAARNETAMAVSLGNLATVYQDERRWLRVLALTLSAALVSARCPMTLGIGSARSCIVLVVTSQPRPAG